MSPDYFVQIINQYLPEPHSSLLSGMIFGQKYSRMGAEFYQALVRTGTLHVVALSGTNVTILIKLIGKLSLPLGGRKSGITTLGAILGFVLFVGVEPPIVRAAIMGGIATLGDFLGKRQYGLLSLLFASGVMLLVRPDWLYSLSFQLSFLATLGIIVFDAPRMGGKIREIRDSEPETSSRFRAGVGVIREFYIKARVMFIENLRTTMAAQVFITPLLVYNFGRLSLVAPLSNALAMWSVGPITWLGIFLAVAGAIFWPLGRVLAWVTWVFLEYFILVVEWTSKVPFGEMMF